MKIPSLACYSPPAVRPIPNRPRASTGPWPRGLGTLALENTTYVPGTVLVTLCYMVWISFILDGKTHTSVKQNDL